MLSRIEHNTGLYIEMYNYVTLDMRGSKTPAFYYANETITHNVHSIWFYK